MSTSIKKGLPNCGHFGGDNSEKMYTGNNTPCWVHDECILTYSMERGPS